MNHAYAGEADEVLGREVRGGAQPGRGECELTGLRLRSLDEQLERLVGAIAGAHHDVRRLAKQRDVDEILLRIVGQVLVDRGVRRVR